MSVVLLHDLGDPEAGAPWRAAAPGSWHVPDLPGHGSTPAPRHGAYDPIAAATLARWALAGTGLAVGVGQNAHAALIVAAGGACERVAIVDGLWGPWQAPEDQVDEMYAGLRRILDDEGAVAPAPAAGLDPRARHGYGVHVSAPFCQAFWGSISVPVLVVETPRSSTPRTERRERVGWFGGPAALAEVADGSPSRVVDVVADWHAAIAV